MAENKQIQKREIDKSARGKKVYCRPELSSYGKLRDLTRGGSGVEPEGTSGMVGMM